MMGTKKDRTVRPVEKAICSCAAPSANSMARLPTKCYVCVRPSGSRQWEEYPVTYHRPDRDTSHRYGGASKEYTRRTHISGSASPPPAMVMFQLESTHLLNRPLEPVRRLISSSVEPAPTRLTR
jgi:hypothetical protein